LTILAGRVTRAEELEGVFDALDLDHGMLVAPQVGDRARVPRAPDQDLRIEPTAEKQPAQGSIGNRIIERI
jgi:hypothetical protein